MGFKSSHIYLLGNKTDKPFFTWSIFLRMMSFFVSLRQVINWCLPILQGTVRPYPYPNKREEENHRRAKAPFTGWDMLHSNWNQQDNSTWKMLGQGKSFWDTWPIFKEGENGYVSFRGRVVPSRGVPGRWARHHRWFLRQVPNRRPQGRMRQPDEWKVRLWLGGTGHFLGWWSSCRNIELKWTKLV